MIISAKAPVRIDFAGGWTDVKYFSHAFGGATTNAAINRYVSGSTIRGAHTAPDGDAAASGIAVTYETTIPAGSGLGTSSALNVVWLALAQGKTINTSEERSQIAERAYQVETVLGILGGKQDHYAAAHGGFNLYEFNENQVNVHPIAITPDKIRELESLCTLCYTGQARFRHDYMRMCGVVSALANGRWWMHCLPCANRLTRQKYFWRRVIGINLARY